MAETATMKRRENLTRGNKKTEERTTKSSRKKEELPARK